ncbi:cyclic-AMP phosphodiesterase [Fistulina hepatica ATCC 64428]|nr:cyclic-AMP phosphodiesterase [Fistulina hepatica ATCC 64428]
MPSFDMVVVGTGGGHYETDLSAYLFKRRAASWKDGILALEGGSGQGALTRLLEREPHLFRTGESSGDSEAQYSAREIYSFVKGFLITHPHLDHILSMVLAAGALEGDRKRRVIYGLQPTLDAMEDMFGNRLWPNLASWDESDIKQKYLYSLLSTNNYEPIHTNVSVKSFTINHGRNEVGEYTSTAFFVRDDVSRHQFLFFGDVEPDSQVDHPRTIDVWRHAAPMIPEHLSTIFIECSWGANRDDDQLYGHLSPRHLVDELVALATEVVDARRMLARTGDDCPSPNTRPRKKLKMSPVSAADLQGSLKGLRVYVTHCKSDCTDVPGKTCRQVIVDEVKALVKAMDLGMDIVAAEQGMRIGACCVLFLQREHG